MHDRWKEAAHLIRPALVFLAGLVIFLLVRSVVVPPSFGQFGHYRGDVLQEVRHRPVQYAGQKECGGCHSEVVEARDKGTHKTITCEACHGPAARHLADSDKKPAKLEVEALCTHCHEADSTKPKWFRQVNAKEHSGGASCDGCHQAHSPKL